MKDDAISRQVVVDTVHKTILGFFSDKDGAMTDTEKTLLSVNKAICDGVRALPSAQSEQRWIPWHSGKFPEESGTYTVTAYDGATERVTYAKYQKRLKRWELTGARAYWRVLAWMPSPKPYKEGE